MSTLFRTTVLTAALASALLASSAQAATATSAFTVSITLTNSCAISSLPLNFGSVTSIAANIDVNTTVTVTCSGANPITVDLNAGTGTGSTFLQREMNNGANVVDFNLYSTAGRTVVLGDGTGATVQLFNGTSTGAAQVLNVYGRVPAQAPKPNGTYSSSVTATVTY